MPRVGRKSEDIKPDVLEVVQHEIPDSAAGAGAAAIPDQRAAAGTPGARPAMPYREGGMTWRRMTRAVAIAEVVGFVALFAGLLVYGVDPFYPFVFATILFAVAAVWIPRATKASAVYSLVVSSLALLMFGGLFFAWTGFLEPLSWVEVTFATVSTLVPLAGVVAGIAVLRHHDGADAAKIPANAVGALCGALVVIGVVGTAVTTDATRLPGDHTVTAHNFEFEQTAITAKAGNVAIYFENKDPFAHNVAIRGHGGSKDARGRNSVRHVFRNLSAGTYEYYCTIHPDDMKGTLTVT